MGVVKTDTSPVQSSLLDDETPYKPEARTFSDVQLVGLTPGIFGTRSAPPSAGECRRKALGEHCTATSQPKPNPEESDSDKRL